MFASLVDRFNAKRAPTPSPTITTGAMPLPAASTGSCGTINSLQELKAMQPGFVRLHVDLVGRDNASKVCVAELTDGQVVFCSLGQEQSDLVRGVQAMLKGKFHAEPRTFLIQPTVLLTLVRDRIDAKALSSVNSAGGAGLNERSALQQAFRSIVEWAVQNGASDIHLNINKDAPDSQVYVHIDGQYVAPPTFRMPTKRLQEIVNVAYLSLRGGKDGTFDENQEQQGRLYESINGREYMLRWGSFVADTGPSVTLRVLDLSTESNNLTFEKLGYLPSQVALLQRSLLSEGGAIVLGGVVGSGKSTTIFTMMSDIPTHRKVMTIEDPVERRIAHALQSSVVRSLDGERNNSMSAKLMTLKRSAATDVLLGEIRDHETGRAFQDIVESGSNLYTTVHVGSAAGIPARLASDQIRVPRDLLGSPGILKLVVYQALLPKLCRHCRLPFRSLLQGGMDAMGRQHAGQHWAGYLSRIDRLYGADSDGMFVRNPEGCEHCRRDGLPALNGYSGRTVVSELFEIGHDTEVLRAIQTGDVIRVTEVLQARRTARWDEPDMTGKTAMECAVYKMLQGEVDPRTIEPRFMSFETVELMRKKP